MNMRSLVDWLNDRTIEYNNGEPTVSDAEWDKKYFELVIMEKRENFSFPDSPTQSINWKWESVSALRKIKHNHPMLSLAKTKDWDEFKNYFKSKDAVCMCKMDGLTLSLRYVDGKLVSAETRGNGEEGEDVLHNARVIPSIPNEIAYKDEYIIDGEIICKQTDFEAFADTYKNPRNFAAGSIRLLDSGECASRKLTFVAWHVVKNNMKTVIDSFEQASLLGFTVVPWTLSMDFDCDDYLKNRAKEEGYPIDGLVGRFNDIDYGNSLNSTSHHSNAAYAFKFYDEVATSRLLDIEWGLGRFDTLTPVAVFEPIEIDGTIVERSSMHNYSVMYETLNGGAWVGQQVSVAKMNMIIPQIVSAEGKPPAGAKMIGLPEVCPICGQLVKVKESDTGVYNLTCENPNCEGKFINRVDHFCGKKGLDITGLSKITLEKLVNWGWIKEISDIYSLKNYRSEWIKKSGFGVNSVDKILKSIEESKQVRLADFIAALGIPLIGKTMTKTLVKNINGWQDFHKKVDEGYYWGKIYGFAGAKAFNINNFDYTDADKIASILTFVEEDNSNNDDSLKGMTIVITGTLHQFKNRDLLKGEIEKRGGKVTGSITTKTSLLINNDEESQSAKNIKAKSLGIRIISENDFVLEFLQKK